MHLKRKLNYLKEDVNECAQDELYFTWKSVKSLNKDFVEIVLRWINHFCELNYDCCQYLKIKKLTQNVDTC